MERDVKTEPQLLILRFGRGEAENAIPWEAFSFHGRWPAKLCAFEEGEDNAKGLSLGSGLEMAHG